MKKEDFIKLGLNEETAAKCEAASLEELKGYIPKSRFDEVNEAKKRLEKDVAERDSQLETLRQNTGDVDGLKAQIKQLQDDNKASREAHAAELRKLRMDNAVHKALADADAINQTAVRPFLQEFLEQAELAEDGTIKGLADAVAKLSASEETSFLFRPVASRISGATPANTATVPPGGKRLDQMTYSEMVAYQSSHPDAKF